MLGFLTDSSSEIGSSRNKGVLNTRSVQLPALDVLGWSASEGNTQRMATCMGANAAE